jgi:hypothetical protein
METGGETPTVVLLNERNKKLYKVFLQIYKNYREASHETIADSRLGFSLYLQRKNNSLNSCFHCAKHISAFLKMILFL